ncbi:hypothetical protein FGSG_12432 [Fusarium graminearum PH-1]|uniref:Chromosome 2, complete genome n=1 Tax=Gibberella zeae (strain ATCC MYA-4620 / CBS 123657 / FGSC 9075 / NRRL 31084 / PH-1) TaxID=229533 RepID=I1S6G1_GIBZE|nr:hypothetical protein FGSG_12432 [Fusarium graminearum PH-1]ESU09773.1 hypothetical protein FGSG_12432 [Fusarium graminearum PH-1]CEF78253.1 unnamed protein product [Fusarium graminearum]|eukprot:XP_011322272.1 hypothetical protein FGSG_12432 [Fusarium graminearum PH-1]
MTLNTLADLHDDIRAHGVNREQGSGDKDWIKRPNTLPVLLDGKEGDKSDIYISNWSFGQLVAVCVWFPTILKFFCLNVGGILPSLRKRVGDMIEITYRIENERPGSDVALESLIPSGSSDRRGTHDMESNRSTSRRSWERIDN